MQTTDPIGLQDGREFLQHENAAAGRNPVRICYLASASSIHTAKWANHFKRNGNGVEILTFERGTDLEAGIVTRLLGRARPLGVHYLRHGAMVRKLVQQIQPDILHAHYASGYATLGRLANFHPYVVSVWGSDIFDFPRKSPVHSKLLRMNLSCADRVCSTSQIMATEALRYCRAPITVTPFGVDCDRFRPVPKASAEKGDFVVGVVKTLEPKYGIEYLIRGFAVVATRNHLQRKMRLVIAGDGSLKKSLQNVARDLGVDGLTTFLGFVPNDRVPQLLNTFSIFVVPSVTPSESFGVAAVEASSCGLPIVASRIGGLPEVVRDKVTGILVPPRDVSALAGAIEELLKNQSLCDSLGEAGRKFVLEHFEWSENAGRMEQVYASLLHLNTRS